MGGIDMGALILRSVVGGLFVGHGLQKLKGWFGGHGLEGTAGFFEMLGLRPGRRHATAAGLAEAGGGALLAAGALTPVASTLLSSTMITAIRKVHGEKGPWVTEGGYEYNVVLIAAVTALAERGPGALSVDRALFPRLHGPGLALLSLGAAAAGSYLVTERLSEEPKETPQTGQAEQGGDPASPQSGRFVRGQEEATTDGVAAEEITRS
jgi:putative oxidoreductase